MNQGQPDHQAGGVRLEKFKLPLGSLLVDLALVFGIIYGAGQITNEVRNLTNRVANLESQATIGMTPAAREAIARLQAQVEANERMAESVSRAAREDHAEVMLRLGRIETLLINEGRKGKDQ